MKWVLVVILALALVSNASADTDTDSFSFGVFEQSKDIELIQTCSNATANCDFCNITSVKFPNSSIIVSNIEMTKRTSDFNYTLSGDNTTTLGVYNVNGYCLAGAERDIWNYDFEITSRGDKLSTSDGLVYIVFLVAVFIVFFLSLYASFRIPFKNRRSGETGVWTINNWKFVKVFFIVMTYILLMWVFGILRSLGDTYLFLAGVSSVFNFLFQMMFWFLWPLLVAVGIGMFLLWIGDVKLKKALVRGVPFR